MNSSIMFIPVSYTHLDVYKRQEMTESESVALPFGDGPMK